MEIWNSVRGYMFLYEVSTTGKIRNANTRKEFKLAPRKDGYIRVGLRKNNVFKQHYLARLIYDSFMGIPDLSFEVNHIDKDKNNNCLSNLELITKRENCCHRSKTKLNKSSNYSGVCKTYNNKYRAYIYIDNKQKSLGYYHTEIEAYQARVNFEHNNNINNKYLV
jgi:hypothetical protein